MLEPINVGPESQGTIFRRNLDFQDRVRHFIDKQGWYSLTNESPCDCFFGIRLSIIATVMHLNDAHFPGRRADLVPWDRLEIADWVDALGIDLTVK